MKTGLGDSYDNVSFLSKKTRAYLDITKPASTVGVAGAYFVASIFYFLYYDLPVTPEINGIIFVSITVALAHGASQAMNMAEDAEMDRNTPHKQNRPIPAGIISEEEARTIAWILSAFAIGRSYLVSVQFGLLMTVLIFMGIFYNLEPIRAKARVISIPWQAVSRGLFLFPAIWAAYGTIWSATAWTLGIFMFWYVLGFQNSADIIDMEIDRQYGVQTFAVMYGVRGIAVIASGSILMMISTVLFGVHFSFLDTRLLSMLVVVPMCLVMLYYMVAKPFSVSESTGNHPSWLWFYAGMVVCVTIPLLAQL